MKKHMYIYFATFVISTILIVQSIYASDFIYPDDTYQMCEEIAAGRIQPEFVQAVIEKESRYDAEAVNGSCIGMMQVNPKWHQDRMDRLGVTDLSDPYQNIIVGTDFLCELVDKYSDPYLVLMMYNMSSDTAQARYDSMDYSNYAIEICERAYELEREHGK